MAGQDTEADPRALEAFQSWLSRLTTAVTGTRIHVPNYDPGRHGRLVTPPDGDGTPLDGDGTQPDADGTATAGGREVASDRNREVDSYWLNAPYAYAHITYDETEDEHRYDVVEPGLDDVEYELLERLFSDVRDPLLYREDVSDDPAGALREELRLRLEEYGVDVGTESFYRLYYYLHRTFLGYGKLDPIMHDPRVEDVSCDGANLPIFVYHEEYTDVETNVAFGAEELNEFVVQLAQRSGRHVSVSEPVVSTTLPDGSRAELALGEEVTPRGSAFTIRKYADEPFTPIDLMEYGTYDASMLAYLWLAIEHNKSLVFAGGTAAGKTTSMNAVSMFVPPRSKVVTIEDTRELSLYHDNWLSSVTRDHADQGTISMYDLLRSSLRHRPEYIIVGEVRGEEAITLFQAMNTGHTTFSTMHADSVQTVINRLENEPINVPRPMVQSLDILCVQVLTRSAGERVRRSRSISEIEGIDQRTGELDYSNTYEWQGESDSFRQSNSDLMAAIREEQGWSQGELRRELRNRRRFLQSLADEGVNDYRRFTAMVNKYYADPESVVETLDGAVDADHVEDGTTVDDDHDGARTTVDDESPVDDSAPDRTDR